MSKSVEFVMIVIAIVFLWALPEIGCILAAIVMVYRLLEIFDESR